MKEKITENYKQLIYDLKNSSARKFEILSVVLLSLWYIYPFFFSDVDANSGIRSNPSALRVSVPFLFIGTAGLILFLTYLFFILKSRKNDLKTIKISGTSYTIVFLIVTLVWEYLSTIFCTNPHVTLDAADGLIYYALYNIYFILAAFFLTSRPSIIFISEILSFTASAIELIILSGSEPLMYVFHLHPAESVFFNQNLHGYYLTIVIPVALCLYITNHSKGAVILHSAELILLSYGLIMAQSTGPLLAVLLSLSVLIIISAFRFRNELKNVITGSVIILASLAVFSLLIKANKAGADFIDMFRDFKVFLNAILNGNTNTKEFNHIGSSRGVLWRAAVTIIKDKPLFGTGVCVPMFEEMEKVCGIYLTPHNELLDYGVQFGIPGMMFYLCIFISLFISGIKIFRKLDIFTICWCVTVMSYFISSMFGNILYEVYPFFIIQLGICWRLVRTAESSKESNT